jgi:hypothetical protein
MPSPSVFIHPLVGKLVEAGGEMLTGEVRQRFTEPELEERRCACALDDALGCLQPYQLPTLSQLTPSGPDEKFLSKLRYFD